MEYSEISELQTFLGPEVLTSGCSLYLPKFFGDVELTHDPVSPSPLQYAGGTFSERDAKAAFYITSILGHVLDSDQIRLEEASKFAPTSGPAQKTAFVFGSRSNQVTIWATDKLPTGKFCKFEFGEQWRIRCADGRVFSVSDPSKLEKGSYANQTDYGVISRLSVPNTGDRLFVIAGLGSRATEGCGYYFSRHWRQLFERYGDNDFAVILQFTPPLDVTRSEPIAWFGDEVHAFS
jgi:hypothetical protein